MMQARRGDGDFPKWGNAPLELRENAAVPISLETGQDDAERRKSLEL